MSGSPLVTHSVQNKRPILLIANSSWYLLHYRKHLLTRLQHECEHVIALCPVDSATPELSNLVIHIPWRIHRATDAHPLSMVISFLRLIFLVRAIKPRLIHSHTLKANLLASIVSALFGVPCVLSFAGLGRLSRASGLPSLLFRRILLFIIFFSRRCRSSRWNWTISNFRSLLIFRIPVDYKFVVSRYCLMMIILKCVSSVALACHPSIATLMFLILNQGGHRLLFQTRISSLSTVLVCSNLKAFIPSLNYPNVSPNILLTFLAL